MRAAGTSTPEVMRTSTGVAALRRAAGVADTEELRAADAAVLEAQRAAGVYRDELLDDPYVRSHPIAPGCSIFSIQGVAGVGTAGCAVAGLDLGYRP